MAAPIPGMRLLRERPWLVALVAGVFAIVLRMAPWPLSALGGLIFVALTCWGLWAAWTHRAWFVRKFRAIRRRIIGAKVDDIQIETRAAVAAAADDSPEGDEATARTRAAWISQIEYLTGLLDSPSHALRKDQRLDYEMMVRQLRRSVRDLDTAEGRPVSLQTHGARPLAAFGPVAAATNPLMLWVGGGLLAVAATGWGWGALKSNEAARYLAERNQAQGDLEELQGDNAALAAQLTVTEAAREIAEASTRETAATIERERTIRRRAEAETRRIRNAEAQARSGSDAFDYGFDGVPDAQPVPGASGDGANAGSGNSR